MSDAPIPGDASIPRDAPVQVVTVSYYSGDTLRTLLESVDEGIDVVVADNAADDDALRDVVADFPAAHVLKMPYNLGYGGAVNRAVAATATQTEWILVANPDLVLADDALAELIRIGSSDPSIGILGPLIRTPAGTIYPSARKLPSLRTGIGHALFVRAWHTNPWTRSYLSDREPVPRQREAGWLSGSVLLIRRSVFEAVGGFDEKYFMYFEDVDLCARISAAGWRVVYAPSAEVVHEGGHSTRSQSRVMVRAHHRSAYLYLSARYGAWYLAPLRLTIRASLAARSMLVRKV